MMIKGIPITLAGERYEIPPIALGDLERLQERLAAYKGGLDGGSVSTVIDAAHAALKRNYTDLTRERVAELVDVANMAEVFEAAMDVSGLKRKGLEAPAEGEDEPGNP